MMLEICFWAQNLSSYEATEEAIRKIYGVNINDDLIRKVTNLLGSKIYENDTINANSYIQKLEKGQIVYPDKKSIDILYVEIDGAALNTRIANKDDSTWRENKLCMVFNSEDIRWWHIKKTGELTHKINRREYISFIGPSKEFKKYIYYIAMKNGLPKAKNIVILSDGATWFRNIKEDLFPEGQQILDFFHLSEHLSDFAKIYFNNNENKYQPWVEECKLKFKNGQHEKVISEIRNIKNKTSIKEAENLYTYLENNRNNINYKQYLDNNYFIGSGAIESGNKIVLQRRLKGPGMRWNPETAQAMLTLKSKYQSGLWYSEVIVPIKKFYGVDH